MMIATDPAVPPNLATAAASVGEPPYYLACAFCHWDSKEVGVTFEKPTGLAVQLQRSEEGAPDIVEFDHLKDHLEPYLRRGQAHSTSSSATLSHSTSVLKDIPGLGTRYGSLFGLNHRARGGEAKGVWDELEKYEPVIAAPEAEGGKGKGKEVDRDIAAVQAMREMQDVEQVASLEKKWATSWNQTMMTRDLKPLRTPLQSKRSKRCPECKHILIKPEQKSSSTRFKIKLVASNYLPAIDLWRRPPATIGSRLSAIAAGTQAGMRRTPRTAVVNPGGALGTGDDEPLRPGRTYAFELTFTNPLYEPIHVKLAVARPPAAIEGAPPPYAVNLPSSHFPISAYAEEWEYEDDEDETLKDTLEEEDENGEEREGSGSSPYKKRRARNAPGIVARKMNKTTVLLEVAVGKDTVGPIRASMLVTYVYQNDDASAIPSSPTKSPVKKGAGGDKDDHKSFSFWTLFPLGVVTPRAESRRSLAVSTSKE